MAQMSPGYAHGVVFTFTLVHVCVQSIKFMQPMWILFPRYAPHSTTTQITQWHTTYSKI